MLKDNTANLAVQLSQLGQMLLEVITRRECGDQLDETGADLSEGFINWSDVEMRQVLKVVVEAVLEAQRTEQIQADYYERNGTRRDYRNGYRQPEKTATPLGVLSGLKIPRLRHQSLDIDWLDRTIDQIPQLRELSSDLFSRGMSVEGLAEVSEALFGAEVSASTVSRFNEVLDERYEAWLETSIEADIQYLFLDGIRLRVCRGNQKCSETALVAMGIDEKGEKHILGFEWGVWEKTETWRNLLDLLEQRGLKPSELELVTVDGNAPLLKVLREEWEEVPVQRCWEHKRRNVLSHVSEENRKEVLQKFKRLRAAGSKKAARRQWEAYLEKWEDREPKVVKCLRGGFEQMFQYLQVPSHHWSIVQTTNYLERAFGEFRRKFKNIPMMPTPASAERLVFAQCDILNKRWRGKQVEDWNRPY